MQLDSDSVDKFKKKISITKDCKTISEKIHALQSFLNNEVFTLSVCFNDLFTPGLEDEYDVKETIHYMQHVQDLMKFNASLEIFFNELKTLFN